MADDDSTGSAGTKAGAFLAMLGLVGVFVIGLDRNRGEQQRSMERLQNERAEHWLSELNIINAEILRMRKWKDTMEQQFPSRVEILDQRLIAAEHRVTRLEKITCPPSITSGGS